MTAEQLEELLRIAMRICASESEVWDEISDAKRARYYREASK